MFRQLSFCSEGGKKVKTCTKKRTICLRLLLIEPVHAICILSLTQAKENFVQRILIKQKQKNGPQSFVDELYRFQGKQIYKRKKVKNLFVSLVCFYLVETNHFHNLSKVMYSMVGKRLSVDIILTQRTIEL